jgi:hypothetical protein
LIEPVRVRRVVAALVEPVHSRTLGFFMAFHVPDTDAAEACGEAVVDGAGARGVGD